MLTPTLALAVADRTRGADESDSSVSEFEMPMARDEYSMTGSMACSASDLGADGVVTSVHRPIGSDSGLVNVGAGCAGVDVP